MGSLAPSGTATIAPIKPALGDWEGVGPDGLALSFELVRSGRRVVVRDFALGLPTGCRTTGFQTWDAMAVARVEYIAPGSALHGPFPPLGPRQFELIEPPTVKQPFPFEMTGAFSSARRGVLSVQSPHLPGCHRGWPRTLHFALIAARRMPVADGLWTGSITGPAPDTGTVTIRVIDGGRIETDFATSYACPGGGGSFELGPLPTTGYVIGPAGRIGGARGTENYWHGRFGRAGTLAGTLDAAHCGSNVFPTFTARRTAG